MFFSRDWENSSTSVLNSIQHCTGAPSDCSQRKRNEKLKDWKRRKTVFASGITIYKASMKQPLELIREFNKVIEYKVNIQKLRVFLYNHSNQLKMKNFKSLLIASPNKENA